MILYSILVYSTVYMLSAYHNYLLLLLLSMMRMMMMTVFGLLSSTRDRRLGQGQTPYRYTDIHSAPLLSDSFGNQYVALRSLKLGRPQPEESATTRSRSTVALLWHCGTAQPPAGVP